MPERLLGGAKGMAPWASLLGTVILALFTFVKGQGTQTAQADSNTQRIERLEQDKADKREMDDVKLWLRNMNDKLDKVLDNQNRK